MSVQLFYVDESFDEQKFCLTGLWVRHRDWAMCFDAIQAHRVHLRDAYGIQIRKEIHAREFVAGRGVLGKHVVTKWQRSRAYLSTLQLIARLPFRIINVCLDVEKYGTEVHLIAWDRLVNRIERTMKAINDDEQKIRGALIAEVDRKLSRADAELARGRLKNFACKAMIISDEGHEGNITKALRRMHVHNPIPSQYGKWPDGDRAKNITTEHIIEDPIFRPSSSSSFLQMADCVAFALLKKETTVTPNIKKYNIHKMFDATLTINCFRNAARLDPLGIVRA